MTVRWAVAVVLAGSGCAGDGGGSGEDGSSGETGASSTGNLTSDGVTAPTSVDDSDASTDPSVTSADGSSDDTGTTGDPACATSLGDEATPLFDPPHGLFSLQVIPGYAGLRGHVTAGPPVPFHHEVEREGQCRLLRFEASTCTPRCLPPSVCVDEACVTPPSFASAGDLVLEGVGGEPHPIADDGFHNYYWEQVGDPTIDMPRLVATGDEVPAFDLSVCPTSAPEPTEDWNALLDARADGEPVTLAWSNPIPTARVYLRMTTGIGTHGGISPVEVECEGPDVGSLVLPGAFLDALYAEGWGCGECGGNDLHRYHGDQTDGDAPVQFRSTAVTSFWHIPGLGG